jgi:hypothetical protein
MSELTDTERLEWMADRTGMVFKGKRAKKRRDIFSEMEDVWQVSWNAENGDEITQSVDARHQTFRDAIDAAMDYKCSS